MELPTAKFSHPKSVSFYVIVVIVAIFLSIAIWQVERYLSAPPKIDVDIADLEQRLEFQNVQNGEVVSTRRYKVEGCILRVTLDRLWTCMKNNEVEYSKNIEWYNLALLDFQKTEIKVVRGNMISVPLKDRHRKPLLELQQAQSKTLTRSMHLTNLQQRFDRMQKLTQTKVEDSKYPDHFEKSYYCELEGPKRTIDDFRYYSDADFQTLETTAQLLSSYGYYNCNNSRFW